MIDCGEEVQRGLLQHKIRWRNIKGIFISHLHGDHYLGLMGLLNTMSMHGRSDALPLFGPPKLWDILQLHFEVSATKLNFALDFCPLEMGKSYLLLDTPQLSVQTIPHIHRVPCQGFVFREKHPTKKLIVEKIQDIPPQARQQFQLGQDWTDADGRSYSYTDFTYPDPPSRSYAFCSDTRYNEEIVPIIEGVDLLYHEATFLESEHEKAHQTFHSTAKEAALLAQKAHVGKLLIGHFSARLRDLQPLLDEARTVFEQTYLAEEGKIFEIGEK